MRLIHLKFRFIYVGIIMIFFGCSNPRLSLIGVYKINLEKSDLNCFNGDKNLYKDLVIEFRDNDSFYLNMNTPFLSNDTGNYLSLVNSEDGERFTDLKYKDDTEDITDRLIDNSSDQDGEKDIFIKNPINRPQACGVKMICFDKLEQE